MLNCLEKLKPLEANSRFTFQSSNICFKKVVRDEDISLWLQWVIWSIFITTVYYFITYSALILWPGFPARRSEMRIVELSHKMLEIQAVHIVPRFLSNMHTNSCITYCSITMGAAPGGDSGTRPHHLFQWGEHDILCTHQFVLTTPCWPYWQRPFAGYRPCSITNEQ